MAARTPWLVAAVPATIAALLGVYRIGEKSVWLDEAFSISVVKLPTLDLAVYSWRNEQQAAPYHFLLQPWSALGDGEAIVRLLSVVLGVVAVLATYAVGRRFGVGLPAALILAVAPFFIEYEQEARGYTMLVAWSSLTTLAYLRLIEHPGRARSVVYVLLAGSMIYVHPMGAWVVVAHGLATAMFVERASRARLLALYVPVVLAWIPMLRFALLNHGRISWVPPTTAEAIATNLTAVGGGFALALVLALLVIYGVRRDVTALWLFVPIVGMLLMSLVKPVWVDRYLIGALPALAVVASRGLVSRPHPRLILAGVLVLSLVGVHSWYVDGRKDDWRAATAWVQGSAQPGDGIVFSPNYYRLPFAYYGQAAEPVYPHVPWSELYLPFLGLAIDAPAEIRHERIWLVRPTDAPLPADLAQVVEGYVMAEQRAFGAHAPLVELLVREQPGAGVSGRQAASVPPSSSEVPPNELAQGVHLAAELGMQLLDQSRIQGHASHAAAIHVEEHHRRTPRYGVKEGGDYRFCAVEHARRHHRAVEHVDARDPVGDPHLNARPQASVHAQERKH